MFPSLINIKSLFGLLLALLLLLREGVLHQHAARSWVLPVLQVELLELGHDDGRLDRLDLLGAVVPRQDLLDQLHFLGLANAVVTRWALRG